MKFTKASQDPFSLAGRTSRDTEFGEEAGI